MMNCWQNKAEARPSFAALTKQLRDVENQHTVRITTTTTTTKTTTTTTRAANIYLLKKNLLNSEMLPRNEVMIITTNITFGPLCKLNSTAGLFERWRVTCLLVAGYSLNI